jgi:hypothetical protein
MNWCSFVGHKDATKWIPYPEGVSLGIPVCGRCGVVLAPFPDGMKVSIQEMADTGQYLDFSNVYNRRKFISASGKPVDGFATSTRSDSKERE